VTSVRLWIQDLCASSIWICRKFREIQMRHRGDGPPFVHLSRPKSAQLFLIYGGMDAYDRGGSICSMGLLKFLQVSGLANRNLTWIRDPFFNNYLSGFGPEIPDRTSLEVWHREHCASMPHVREIYTLGYSSGSYGALYFGHLLGAKKAWAFSPRTADWATDAEAKAALRERLQQENGVTEYEIWHGHKNRLDRDFARAVGDCPGVSIHAHTGYGATHFLIDRMIRSGEFQKLLPPNTDVTAPMLTTQSDG
jgi:hypothetical protein